MSNDPDQIRAQIEETRSNLSTDVNTLAGTVRPGNVAKRQVDRVRGAASSARDAVMGAVPDLGSAGGTLGDAQGAVQNAPATVMTRTRGNPLAAGLIAFGAGWLAASLVPATQQEQDVAAKLKDNASVVTDELSSMAKEVGGNLKEPAQEAAESVKATAVDAAGTVKSEGVSAAQDVKDQSDQSTQVVQNSRA